MSANPRARAGGFEEFSSEQRRLLELLIDQKARSEQKIAARSRGDGSTPELFPTSWAQQRLWFIDQLESGGAGYVSTLALRLHGMLNREALQRALDTIVQRHEALRTVFVSVEGAPQQQVLAHARFELKIIDLSHPEELERNAQVRAQKLEEAHTKFDLRTGPLIRGRLLRLQNHEHVLLVTVHHVVFDGWSMGVFRRELAELYRAYHEGRDNPLPLLPIQYADYTQWQRKWLQGESLERQLKYWRAQLENAPPQLELPASRARSGAQSYRGENVEVLIDAQTSKALRAFAQRHDLTLFMVLQAAWAILLSKLSGQEDIVTGMPVANRQRPELEGLIGFFVNSLVLRMQVRGEMRVDEFLEHVKAVTVRAYEHQDVPFEKVVEALRPERSLSRHPLFQVIFALQNMPGQEMQLPGLTLAQEPGVDEPAVFDLFLSLEDRGGEIAGSMNYAADLFERSMIRRWMSGFTMLLRALTESIECRIADLPVMPQEEWQQVVRGFNATQAPYPARSSIQELFESQVHRTPDAVAVVCEEELLTYAQLNERANQLARYLMSQGVVVGDYIPILMPRSLRMVIAQLAVLKCGAVYVPVDPTLPAERRALLIRDCGARHILTDGPQSGDLELADVRWMDCIGDRAGIESCSTSDLSLKLDLVPPAYVMYTSGSSGIPKGVIVPHAAVIRLVISNGYAQILATDCVAHCSNPAFDASTLEVWGPLLNGARVLIVAQSVVLDAERFAEVLLKHSVTVLWLTAGLFVQYAASLAAVFRRLRYLIAGGDALEPGAVRRVLQKSPPQHFLNGYGPTEGTTFSATHLIESVEADATSIPIGRPIGNTQIYILDKSLQPVPVGVTGEIHIGGAGLALGYLNRPELTRARFIADPFSSDPQARLYKSGDLGRWRADGVIEFLGRNDQQVKLRGYRIELEEIEAHLLQHPRVKEAVVIARSEETGEKRLVAYVVPGDAPPSDQPEQAAEQVGAEFVRQWKALYEQTYGAQSTGPSFLGWNSSYSGEPVPEEQMQEWLAATLERIRQLRPRKMLEIGCGVGLLLQHLAPQCEVYVGTDFSASAVNQLRHWVSGRADLQHVELLNRSATELQDLPAGAFDTIVINSVVQYFPDVSYLLTVLQESVRLLAPGGKIFIGDVRHLGLLSMFHSAVQLSKAAVTVNAGQLKKRIERAVAADKELVIDPRLFQALPGRLPGISSVDIQLKRGHALNELTRYRYGVVLHTGELTVSQPSCESVDWRSAIGSIAELEKALTQRRWTAVRLTAVPNARLAHEAAAQALIHESSADVEAGTLRRLLTESPAAETNPEVFWQLGETHGYEVSVRWTTHGDHTTFDVELADRSRAGQIPRAPAISPAGFISWNAYVNHPLDNSLRQQLIPELREHLKARLPEYMIPSAWMALKQLPLTPNGKVDRRALPAPQSRPDELGEYIAPRTDTERALAGIWAELLRVDQVGVNDNFFELGGHSLLIVQMLERLRRSGLSAEVRTVYGNPTIAGLASALSRESVEQVTVPPNLIPPDCERITPQMLPLISLEDRHIEIVARAASGGVSNVQDVYPLTPLQEGMLFHYLLDEEGKDAYARPLLLAVSSEEYLSRFLSALQSVVNRHDILRTAVLWEQLPQAIQVVHRTVSLPIEHIELNPLRDALEQLKARMASDAFRLDLQRAPLMRVEVATDPQRSKWYVLLRTHHVIFDNESLRIILAEVAAHMSGQAGNLPEPLPYRNHVAHVLERTRTHDPEGYFRGKLADVDEPTAPFGLLNVRGDGSQNAVGRLPLDAELRRRIHVQARSLNVSSATLFHAAWALAVAQTSGREDVVFGSVLLGRMQGDAGAQCTLGMFINTLPLRIQLKGTHAKALIEQTQRELVELLSYEHASLATAQRCSNVPGSMPLFSTLLNYVRGSEGAGQGHFIAPGVTLLASVGHTNYPIVLTVHDRDEDLRLEIETAREIDPDRMLGYMTSALHSLLRALEEDSAKPALALLSLPAQERRNVLELFNQTQAPYPQDQLLHELFEEQALRTPHAIAVSHERESLTYAQLNARANQFARYLRAHGAGPEQLVALCVDRSAAMLVGILGILKAGGAYLPLDPSNPPERLKSVLADAAPRLLITEERFLDLFVTIDTQLIVLERELDEIATCGSESLGSRVAGQSPRNLAYVIYTSGSTGKPKGVMVEHRNIVNYCAHVIRQFDVAGGSGSLFCSSISFDLGLTGLYPTLLCGRTVRLCSERDGLSSLQEEVLQSSNLAPLKLTPSHLALLEDSLRRGELVDRVRVLVLGGEALQGSTVKLWREHAPGTRVFNHYGPTETTVGCIVMEATEAVDGDVPIGKPISNTRIYILSSHLQPVPIGVAGDIYIGGAGVARGYFNRPNLTEERFVRDPFSTDPEARIYKSGDLGRWRADGTIEFLGRSDSQVKLRGFRIELAEIEAHLRARPPVRDAAVVVREDVAGEKRLVAYVTGVQGEASVEKLRTALKMSLPDYMVPSAFVALENLPLTPNGKLDRRALPEPTLVDYATRSYEPPQSETELRLAELWQGLLRVERIGRHDDFFEVGGNSLLAMKMISRACDAFSVRMSVGAVFQFPTIARLAAAFDVRRSGPESAPPVEDLVFDEGAI